MISICMFLKFSFTEMTFGNINMHLFIFCSLTFIPNNDHGAVLEPVLA